MNANRICLLVVCMFASVCQGAEVLRRITWDLPVDSPPGVSTRIVADSASKGDAYLKITNQTSKPVTLSLLTLDNPTVNLPAYAIQGQVRYQNVRGRAYLEMWSHFGVEESYFSRTLSQAGPMRALTGSSDWRAFRLPFFSSDGRQDPTKLVVDLILPGRGHVCISELELIQAADRADLETQPDQWWSSRHAGLFGGIGGGIIGLFGALIGILAGWGKAKHCVFSLASIVIVAGTAALLAGLIAVSAGQPFSVYYPLLLLGGISVFACGANIMTLRRRYRQLELRQMQAQNV